MGHKCIKTNLLCPFWIMLLLQFTLLWSHSSLQSKFDQSVVSFISKQIKALPKTTKMNQLTAPILCWSYIFHNFDKKKEKDVSEKWLFEYLRIAFMFYAFSRNMHILDFQNPSTSFCFLRIFWNSITDERRPHVIS